ncbi:MAG: hypothetical protein FWE86_01760, partial [Oscillospiraceae bacterium]|nr:hypothetical protein [Oscillospiraceae bacterium]
GALCLVLPAGLYWGSLYCPGRPSAAMTGLRIGAACSLLAAGGLVCAAWAHADLHESRFSWKGLLTGILTIMLIDIAI